MMKTEPQAQKTEEQIKKEIDYKKVIEYNEEYIAILIEEKQWYQLEINSIDLKVLKGASNDLKHEMSLKRILAHKKIHTLTSEIESKLNFIEQMKGFIANDSKEI